MSLPHQIGAISGAPLAGDSGGVSGEAPSSATVSAVWRSPAASSNLRVSASDSDRVSPSPPVSPRLGGTGVRPDLSVAAQALMSPTAEAAAAAEEREYVAGGAAQGKDRKGVPVFVMMPLDSVTWNHTVNRKKAMNASLQALKSAGVEGIMMDVWWGLVEGEKPGEYNWSGYVELLEMAKKHGLKVQAVMSFHQCGGNVGDSCT